MNNNPNPSGELSQVAINAPAEIEVPESMMEFAQQFRESMMRYSCAIREVKTKLEVLNDDLSVRKSRNPIEMLKSRVKRPESVVEKLQRRGFPVSIESMEKNLDDVAGVRVICTFIDDIYDISRMLALQSDVKVLAVKDYIRCPKDNGYRSYHMIVRTGCGPSGWRCRSAPSPWISGQAWSTSCATRSTWRLRTPTTWRMS